MVKECKFCPSYKKVCVNLQRCFNELVGREQNGLIELELESDFSELADFGELNPEEEKTNNGTSINRSSVGGSPNDTSEPKRGGS